METFSEKYEAFVSKYGLSGSAVKLIAIVCMLIDHVGAGIIYNRIHIYNYPIEPWMEVVYEPMRNIGRIAFPLFCFFLVEGFAHTRNVWKYLGRLVLFGAVSEIPFNLAFFCEPFYVGHQNVFWTLALGVLMMVGLEKVSGLAPFKKEQLNRAAVLLSDIAILCVTAYIADLCHTDYKYLGIMTIFVIYISRNSRVLQLVAVAIACVMILNELPALFCLIPLALYNGRRGFGMKYLFYGFYPVHLIVIWGVGRLFLGMK